MRIMMLFGMFFGIIGVILLIKEILKRKKCTVSTKGVVVDISREVSNDSDGNRSITLYPIFEYNVSGEKYVQKSKNGSNFCKYHIGQEVEILYNPDKPENYYVKNSFGSIIIGVGFIILGIIFIFL